MATSMPFRLPDPPGLAANATTMSKSAAPEDESPTFTFQRRYHKLDWQKILHVDLGRLIQQVDLQTLHQQLEPITFADIGPDDVEYFTDNNFLHLFRLCQLLLEYELFAWKATTIAGNMRTVKYQHLKEYSTKLKGALVKSMNENRSLKKEVAYCKKVIQVLEEKERAMLLNQQQLQQQHQQQQQYHPLGGSVGRHPLPHQQPHPPSHPHHQPHHFVFPHPPLAPHPPTKGQEEEKEQPPFHHHSYHPANAFHHQHHPQLHSHYTSQLQSFQADLTAKMQEENTKRNAQLENLQASLQLLLQAQQDEMKKQQDQALKEHEEKQELYRKQQQQLQEDIEFESDSKSTTTPSAALPPPTLAPSPSQAAQQQLINSILREVTTLKAQSQASASSLGEQITIGAFVPPPPELQPSEPLPSSSTFIQPNTVGPPTTTVGPIPSPTSSPMKIVQLGRAPSIVAASPASATIPSTNPQPLPSPSTTVSTKDQSGLRPSARIAPVYSPEQQAELDSLSTWLKNIEAEELGAEIVKIQLESALVERAEAARKQKELMEAEEREVQRIEASMPPDHPLIEDTILAQVAATVPKESKLPPTTADGTPPTIELLSPMAITNSIATGTGNTDPILIGSQTLIMPPPYAAGFVKTMPTTREPVIPPAPLADNTPVLTHEERLEKLLSLSPTSRIKALEQEKVLIKLRSVIQARSSVDQALYAPFPTMPFLSSLYNHAPETLRECYDEVYLWADTAMRTEAGAQELLKYAVQMDCTGEIYKEVADKVSEICKLHFEPPPEYIRDIENLRELERQNVIHGQEEAQHRLDHARWEEARFAQAEREWAQLQQLHEDQQKYRELEEEMKREHREVEFQEYLKRLDEQHRRYQQAHHQLEQEQPPQTLYVFPHNSDSIQFSTSPKLSTRTSFQSDRRSTSPTKPSGDRQQSRSPRIPSLAPNPTTTSTNKTPIRKPGPPLPNKQRSKPGSGGNRVTRLALKNGEDDDEDEDEEEEEEESASPQPQSIRTHNDEKEQTEQEAEGRPTTPPRPSSSEPIQPELSPVRAKSIGKNILLNSPHAPPSQRLNLVQDQKADNTRLPQHRPIADDSDDEEAEDDDHEARTKISRLNSATTSSFESAPASQFSRPLSKKKLTSNLIASQPNSTPEKGLSLAQEQLGTTPPALPISRPTAAAAAAFTRPTTSAGTRPKTSVGSRPRFFTGDESFEDEEENNPHQQPEQEEEEPSTPRQHTPDPFTAEPARTLNPRRSAAINLSALNKPVAGSHQPILSTTAARAAPVISSRLQSSRPIATLISTHDTFNESDDSVSDVSNVMNLDPEQDQTRSSSRASNTVVGSADLNLPTASPSPSLSTTDSNNPGAPPPSLPISQPTLMPGQSLTGSTGTSGILQPRGRPRSQQGKLPSSNMTPFVPPEEDSLSSLLGGSSFKRPMGRGLSGPGGFKSRIPIKPESDNDSSLNLDD